MIPARKLTNPRIFVLEVGTDGFNAYEEGQVFAASSSMSTFIRVMETIANSNGNSVAHFQLVRDDQELA